MTTHSPLSVRAVLLALSLTALPALAYAQDAQAPSAGATAESAAESRSAAFQAVSGNQGEDVPGGALLVAAYGAVLAMVLGYVLYMGRLTAGTAKDLERLERTLAAATPRPAPAGSDEAKSGATGTDA